MGGDFDEEVIVRSSDRVGGVYISKAMTMPIYYSTDIPPNSSSTVQMHMQIQNSAPLAIMTECFRLLPPPYKDYNSGQG